MLNDLRESNREERDGQVIEISRSMSGRRMTERLRIDGPRGAGKHRREQRLYNATELQQMMERVELPVTSMSESLQGTPFDNASSPSIWIVSVHR